MYKKGKYKSDEGFTFTIKEVKSGKALITWGNNKSCTCTLGELDLMHPQPIHEEEDKEKEKNAMGGKDVPDSSRLERVVKSGQRLACEKDDKTTLDEKTKKNEDSVTSGSVDSAVKTDYDFAGKIVKPKLHEEADFGYDYTDHTAYVELNGVKLATCRCTESEFNLYNDEVRDFLCNLVPEEGE